MRNHAGVEGIGERRTRASFSTQGRGVPSVRSRGSRGAAEDATEGSRGVGIEGKGFEGADRIVNQCGPCPRVFTLPSTLPSCITTNKHI